MTKTYGLKAIRALIPMAREALPLLASYIPFEDDSKLWMARYIVDSQGFWLQVNDKPGQGGGDNSPLSNREVEGMTGLNLDELEASSLDGVGYRWGLPGGAPLLPLPFTARQFFDFNKRTNKAFSNAMMRMSYPQLSEEEFQNLLSIGPPAQDSAAWEFEGRDLQAEWIAGLETANPNAAELARIILSGVVPDADPMDSETRDALDDAIKVSDQKRPCLLVDQRDPTAKQEWYIPARYFARQLVIEDSTLLTKKKLLATKVSQSLAGAGIFKRGGTKPPSDATVLKAFVNVALS